MPTPYPEITTMATDGLHLLYDAAFVDSLSLEECEGVLCHEVGHCALLHLIRCGGRDPMRWNIAADAAVNALLVADGIKLPAGGVPPGPLDKTAEELYDELPKNAQLAQVLRDLRTGDGDADGDDKIPGKPSLTPAQLERKWKHAVAQAAGLLPGSLRRVVEAANESRIPWREILMQFITRYIKAADRTWTRTSRRLPNLMPGWARDPQSEIAIVIDTSGSIDGPLLQRFVSECQSIMALNGITVYVMAADAAVGCVVEPGQPFPADLPGGGGTDFRPALSHCEGLDSVVAVIYCTDGEGTYPAGCNKPVIWAMSTNHVPPFGEVVNLLKE